MPFYTEPELLDDAKCHEPQLFDSCAETDEILEQRVRARESSRSTFLSHSVGDGAHEDDARRFMKSHFNVGVAPRNRRTRCLSRSSGEGIV